MDKAVYQKVIAAALSYVSIRPRSEKELQRFIERRVLKLERSDDDDDDEEEELVATVLGRLRELGYADDISFARTWVENRGSHRPKGMRVLKQELTRKGIKPEIIEEVLGCQPESEFELARRAVGRRFELYSNLPSLERKKRIWGFLMRRGFDGGVISRLVDELVETRYNTKDTEGNLPSG